MTAANWRGTGGGRARGSPERKGGKRWAGLGWAPLAARFCRLALPSCRRTGCQGLRSPVFVIPPYVTARHSSMRCAVSLPGCLAAQVALGGGRSTPALRLRRAPVPLVRQRFGSRCNVHLYPLQTVPASHAAAVQPRPPYSYKPTIHCRVRRPPASSRKSSIPTVRQPKPTASPPLRPRTSRSSPHRYQLPSKRLRLHHLIPAPLVDDVALVASPCSMRDSPTHS